MNLRAISPELIAILAEQLQTVKPSQWETNTSGWHTSHEEQTRSRSFASNAQYLPTLQASEVCKRSGRDKSHDLGSEYRFSFENTHGDKVYEIVDLRVKSDGSYEHLDFSSLYEVSGTGTLRAATHVSGDYYQAMDKIGLLSFISEQLPEEEYTQPGVYGLKILDTILRTYLIEGVLP
jgi:hypothetical protein